MKRLVDCVEVITNNDECVILKVKNNCEMDLISLGCFSGNEVMFRMTKDEDEDCFTIFSKNSGEDEFTTCTWGSRTLVSKNLSNIARKIRRCIVGDLDIYMSRHNAFLKREGLLK